MTARLWNTITIALIIGTALAVGGCGGDAAGGGDSKRAPSPEPLQTESVPTKKSSSVGNVATNPDGASSAAGCDSDAAPSVLRANAKVPAQLLAAARRFIATTDDPAFAGARISGVGEVIAGCAKGTSYAFVAQFKAPHATCTVDLEGWFSRTDGAWTTDRLVCVGDIGGICANTPKVMRSVWYDGKDDGMFAGCGWKR